MPKFGFSGAKWGRGKQGEGRREETGYLQVVVYINNLLHVAPATEFSGNFVAALRWETGRSILCPA